MGPEESWGQEALGGHREKVVLSQPRGSQWVPSKRNCCDANCERRCDIRLCLGLARRQADAEATLDLGAH